MPLIMALPFEFALEGPPVSQQTRRRALVRQWTQTVRNRCGGSIGTVRCLLPGR